MTCIYYNRRRRELSLLTLGSREIFGHPSKDSPHTRAVVLLVADSLKASSTERDLKFLQKCLEVEGHDK